MLAWYLQQLRRQNITEKKKSNKLVFMYNWERRLFLVWFNDY
jgi:hypothetical protein